MYPLCKIIIVFLACTGLWACSQSEVTPGKHYTVGIINPNKVNTDLNEGFKSRMTALGYRENENITYIIHNVPEDLSEAASDLAARKVDLIFAFTTPAAKMVRKATAGTGIPMVFAVYDPVNSGLINSLTEPGPNLTGIQIRGSAAKSLEWLLALSPGIKKLFIPVKFDTAAAKQDLSDVREAAGAFGLKVITAEVNTVPELDAALSGMGDDIDAIFLTRSILIASNAKRIVDQAIKRKLPVGSSTSMFKHGATITYGVESYHVGRQAARLAGMILHGNKPETIPAEISEFYLGINLQSAEAAGIEVPNELLSKADFVVPEKGL